MKFNNLAHQAHTYTHIYIRGGELVPKRKFARMFTSSIRCPKRKFGYLTKKFGLEKSGLNVQKGSVQKFSRSGWTQASRVQVTIFLCPLTTTNPPPWELSPLRWIHYYIEHLSLTTFDTIRSWGAIILSKATTTTIPYTLRTWQSSWGLACLLSHFHVLGHSACPPYEGVTLGHRQSDLGAQVRIQ